MMWTFVLLAEVILAVGCFFWAKWWIKNKTNSDGEVSFGKTTMVWGEDSSDMLEKMSALAKKTFSKGELLKSEDGFSTQVSMKNNVVTEVVIRTNKSKVTYNGKELDVVRTSNSKTDVIAFLTMISWASISLVFWIGAAVIITIQIFYQIFSQI